MCRDGPNTQITWKHPPINYHNGTIFYVKSKSKAVKKLIIHTPIKSSTGKSSFVGIDILRFPCVDYCPFESNP